MMPYPHRDPEISDAPIFLGGIVLAIVIVILLLLLRIAWRSEIYTSQRRST